MAKATQLQAVNVAASPATAANTNPKPAPSAANWPAMPR